MKKIIAMLLACFMVMGMAACGGEDTPATTEGKVETPASALEVLENVWAKYADEEKFFAMGGFKLNEEGIPEATENAPGVVEDADYVTGSLLVPAEQTANITETASLVHGQNTNFFTGAAYMLVDGADAKAFGSAMQTVIQASQWLCGAPEQLLIANVGGVLVVAYGHADIMTTFQNHLAEAYAGAEILVNEAIG